MEMDLQDLSQLSVKTDGKETDREGRFLVEPLVQGYGHTLGNSLRRVLLSSLPGAAITQVQIAGVKHQFSTIEGVAEDVVQILLNLKQIRLKLEDKDEAKMKLSVKKTGVVKAGDFEVPAGVTIVNPDLHLATLSGKKPRLTIEAKVETGRGYRIAGESETSEIGVIAVDAMFTPMKRVNYTVEPIRVGRFANHDRLVLELLTDGTIKPSAAIKEAAEILVRYFSVFVEARPESSPLEKAAQAKKRPQVAEMPIEELELPTRIANSLRRGGVETVAALVSRTAREVAEIPNLGDKSVERIAKALKSKGLSFREE
jgi:DNA-directed RNA polymerase subunit alpha